MKYSFKQIFAVATSALMLGMTAGVAGAANYPSPFVTGGSGDFAVVHGASAPAGIDSAQATSIASDLLDLTTSGAVALGTDVVSLGSSSAQIWLNRSLSASDANTGTIGSTKTLTKSDLSSVLADYTFSGNADRELTSTIKVGLSVIGGKANSNKVIFAKQPSSSDDPVLGISMGANKSLPMYNATVTFSAINFSHSDSEGETIRLFGRDFVVSTATDFTDLVLFKSAQEVSLSSGGTNPSTATVTVDGTTYTVGLVTGSGTSSATISVNGEQKSINSGSSKKVNGLEVAVKEVTESTALSKIDVTLLVGSEKLTLTDGTKVKVGSDDDPIDGTEVQLVGHGTGATTEVTVSVFAPRTNNDAISAGESFVDPVFESFQFQFTDINEPVDSDDRETITIQNSGDDGMTLVFTDHQDSSGTIEWAYNKSMETRLADLINKTIHVREKVNVSEEEYVVLGNEDYGALVKVETIYNDTSSTYTKDQLQLSNVLSGETYDGTFTAEGTGTVTIHGKQHAFKFGGDGSNGAVSFDSADATATQVVLYPTIQTSNGALLFFYEPLQIALRNWTITPMEGHATKNNLTAFRFPDGDGYTDAAVIWSGGTTTTGNWSIGGTVMGTGNVGAGTANWTTVTVGVLQYNFTRDGNLENSTRLFLNQPVTKDNAAATNIVAPAIVIFEPKDDASAYEAVIIELENAAAGTADAGLGVTAIRYTSNTHWSDTQRTDNKLTEAMDWFGTHSILDAGDSDQQVVEMTIPSGQVFANVNVGDLGESTDTPELGSVLVTDSEVTSVQAKNLVVVGGSCVNSVAASLVGGAYCGDAWTTATSVGTGQFVIQSYDNPYTAGKVALLVAGYEKDDTVNAATYLRNRPEGDIDTTVGKKYVGTSGTQATLTVE